MREFSRMNRLMTLVSLFRLSLKGSRKAVGFDLASDGEIQFLRDALLRLVDRRPDLLIFIFHHGNTREAFDASFPSLQPRVFHAAYSEIVLFRNLDLYITTEQFVAGPPTVYTVTIFHGQPAKGVTFKLPGFDPLALNDAMFLYGPLHRQTLSEHLATWQLSLPSHLSLFDIGYSKSDRLLNGVYERSEVLRSLGLDLANRTILYAPAFNEGASMREYAHEIIPILCGLDGFNIIAKLAIDCGEPHRTGGINWFTTIGEMESRFRNFRIVRQPEADPVLACADLLITCVSSIGFEFLALKKPVIFIDTPKFFSETLAKMFPGHDCSSWVARSTVNGGREFGLVVAHPSDLPRAIDHVLSNPDQYPRRRSELPGCLLYNPGHATEAAVQQIERLLAEGVRSRRPAARLSVLFWLAGRAASWLRKLFLSRHPWSPAPERSL